VTLTIITVAGTVVTVSDTMTVTVRGTVTEETRGGNSRDPLRVVAGLDVSFSTLQDSNAACAALVAVEVPSLQVLWDDFELLEVTEPYVPGFLAFREVSSEL